MKTKKQYRVRNWSKYSAALVNRGSVTIWLDQDATQGWLNTQRSGKRGASCVYSSGAIQCALMVQCVYHLTLRSSQGFLQSVFALMGLALPVPDYTTLCRRRKTLEVSLKASASATASATASGGLHLVVDGTGLKVYGEGEWKVRKHGWCKRRKWLSVQVGINRESGEVVAVASSEHAWSDKSALPVLLDQVEGEIESVTGDGAYDARSCYEEIAARDAQAIIPPFRRARLRKEAAYASRNAAVKRIRELDAEAEAKTKAEAKTETRTGRKKWKEEVGYHKRSRIESTMMQLKTIFGDKVSARNFDSQASEVRLRCAALNRMMSLGMPQSEAV